VSDADRLHDVLGLGDAAALLVDTLSPAEAARLRALVDDARTAEAAEVDAGVHALVAAVPWFARGQVRRLLRDHR
jgi:hypothetical protein